MCKFILEPFPILLLSDLNKQKVELIWFVFLESSYFYPFQIDFSYDLIWFVDKWNIVSFDFNPSISVLEEGPTFFGQQLKPTIGQQVPIRIVLMTLAIKEYIKEVVNNVELGDRSRMLFLFLKFIITIREILPSLVPLLRH